jgi:hypothetical protein
MYGKKENDMQRIDMNLVGRNGAIDPLIHGARSRRLLPAGCVVTSATFANAQYFLEYRPFIEDTDFWGTNPGMNWQSPTSGTSTCRATTPTSTFHRESPTMLVITPAAPG